MPNIIKSQIFHGCHHNKTVVGKFQTASYLIIFDNK